jgi:DNA end-binding protein Ku
MPRAIWSGAISFGLVNVPVKLYSATSPKTVRFHQLAARTGARIRQKRVDSSTGEEVPYEEIVKGYELAPDRYVRIEPEELEALDPKATHAIEIEEFVEQSEIDPIYYDHTYYVMPSAGGAKAYRLLLEAMRSAGKVGIGRIVLRSRQQLCALRPVGEALALTTMLFGDEVLAPERLDELDAAASAQASERELAMARQLVDTLSGHFDPAKFKDEYRERVVALIERKAAGEQILVPPPQEQPSTSAPDLMAALEASLAAVRGRGGASKGPAQSARQRSARRKGAAAKDGAATPDDQPRARTAT